MSKPHLRGAQFKKAKIPPKILPTSLGLPETSYIVTENGANCVCFAPKMDLGVATVDQLKKMLVNPAIQGAKVRLMPDAHKCPGCLVGFTYEMKPMIVPLFLGGDLACGVATIPIPARVFRRLSLDKIEHIIRKSSKIGSGYQNIWTKPIVTEADLERLFQESQVLAAEFSQKYHEKFNLDISAQIPKYNLAWLKTKCIEIGANYDKDVLLACASLGGGNHFIEVNQVVQADGTADPDGECYLTVHSGSRTFGSDICKYHQNKIKADKDELIDDLDRRIKQIEREHKDSKTIKELTDQARANYQAQRHKPYLEGSEAAEYFMDLIFCQGYASLNRRLILKHILEALESPTVTTYLENDLPPMDDEATPIASQVMPQLPLYDETKIIESVHNYIDFRDLYVRKGAISAKAGELCVIAFNMADGILIAEGKGNPDWNYSCAHGSGRAVPRQKAQTSLSMKQFQEDMKHVCTTSVCRGTLDESPAAYKDTKSILDLLEPTIKPLKRLISILNLKASNED